MLFGLEHLMKRLLGYLLSLTFLGLASCSTTHLAETDIYTQQRLTVVECLKSATQSIDNAALPSLVVANHIVQKCNEPISTYEQSRALKLNIDSASPTTQRLAHWVLLSDQIVLESRTGLPFP